MIPSDRPVTIIPDIHGRSFWKEALRVLPEGHLVFLGDYLDPYEEEGISDEKAIYNLFDIVALKQSHPENITLLWGNHDLHYLYRNLRGSRYDEWDQARISQFLFQNKDLFKIAEDMVLHGRRFLFTHAGAGRKWLSMVDPLFRDTAPGADALNGLMQSRRFIEALGAIPVRRGGWSEYGSIVWADLKEHTEEDNQYKDIIQVFGHTQLSRPYNLNGRVYCLDCRRCFHLNPVTGTIEEHSSYAGANDTVLSYPIG